MSGSASKRPTLGAVKGAFGVKGPLKEEKEKDAQAKSL